MQQQAENLIITRISQPDVPPLIQVTEAGIIGKIGFNAAGVGTCLNAIKVLGVDAANIPAHLGLRMVLESRSVDEAVRRLKSCGMASSAHILIADPESALGLEFTRSTFAECGPVGGRVVHGNHLVGVHPGEVDTIWLRDSLVRVETMRENAESLEKRGGEVEWRDVEGLFEDEKGLPYAICRKADGSAWGSTTLFNIVMELGARRAVVRVGRPVEGGERIELRL